MDVVIWVLAGSLVGWAGFSWFRSNAARGMMLSILIGAVAGAFGGAVLAPMLGAATVNPGDFQPFALFMAFVSAAACLIIGDMIYNRFGV